MSRRRHELEDDLDEDLNELESKFNFRNPYEKKRNRHADDTPLSKGKRNRQKHEKEFE